MPDMLMPSMHAVQENLAQEQKLFAGANTVLLQSILSPVQAGLLMLDAWPAHCDCFAFATVALNEVRSPRCDRVLQCLSFALAMHAMGNIQCLAA